MTRIAIFLAALVGLTACETVGGLGRDVRSAGEAVEETAEEVQEDM
jgi:predicted small secreted protein